MITGGSGVNVVPEHCRVEVDVGMTQLEEGEAALATLLNLKPFNPEVTLQIEGQVNRPLFQKTNAIAALFEHLLISSLLPRMTLLKRLFETLE